MTCHPGFRNQNPEDRIQRGVVLLGVRECFKKCFVIPVSETRIQRTEFREEWFYRV